MFPRTSSSLALIASTAASLFRCRIPVSRGLDGAGGSAFSTALRPSATYSRSLVPVRSSATISSPTALLVAFGGVRRVVTPTPLR